MTSIQAAHSIRRIHEATSGTTGTAFFRSLARSIADVLGTRFGFAGEVVPGVNRVRALAFWDGREFTPDFEYDLDHTPCSRVVAGNYCRYPSHAQQQFPGDSMLVDLGIHAYFGIPIRRPDGEARGILVALHDAPVPTIGDLDDILAMFAVRASAELDRRDAERSLRESERRYREIVTTCAEGVWTIDAQGLTTFVNTQMATMLGYQSHEMLGRSVFDFMDDAGRQQTLANMERRRQGLSELHSFELRHQNGRAVHTWMNTSPLQTADGSFAGALAMVTDVTEQLALQARMREAHKLESLGLLAGGIAHDFNNLLVGVLGRADLTLAQLDATSPARPLVEGMRDAAERAAELTRQLLAYAGKAQLSMQPVNLSRAVREIAGLVRSSAASHVSMEVNVSDPNLTVAADPGALTQIILNLLTNAVQALGEHGGRVEVSTSLEHRAPSRLVDRLGEPLPPGDYAVLRVSDDGAGMDSATRERAFEPFFTTKEHGRGLGLAAVNGIVDTHGGAITVTSTPGSGTSFSVFLPATSAAESTPADANTGRERATGKGRVLLAEDELAVRDVVRMALEAGDYEVDACCDGASAIARFSEAPDQYVAVLLDVTMPGGGGLEAARAIASLRPNMPVLMMSGYSDEELPATLRLHFIQKPFRVPALLDAVHAAVLQTR